MHKAAEFLVQKWRRIVGFSPDPPDYYACYAEPTMLYIPIHPDARLYIVEDARGQALAYYDRHGNRVR